MFFFVCIFVIKKFDFLCENEASLGHLNVSRRIFFVSDIFEIFK